MCFQLYAGTSRPIPRKGFNKNARALSVESLTKEEEPIRAWFNTHEVQYIGSTSGCGCDFPHFLFQNGEWPALPLELIDAEQVAGNHCNQESLVSLLRETGEKTVELYGVWSGDCSEPKI